MSKVIERIFKKARKEMLNEKLENESFLSDATSSEEIKPCEHSTGYQGHKYSFGFENPTVKKIKLTAVDAWLYTSLENLLSEIKTKRNETKGLMEHEQFAVQEKLLTENISLVRTANRYMRHLFMNNLHDREFIDVMQKIDRSLIYKSTAYGITGYRTIFCDDGGRRSEAVYDQVPFKSIWWTE